MEPLLAWLIQGAVGPAFVGLPVTWAATDLAGAARRWFKRLRGSDALGRMIRAADSDLGLSGAEFARVRRLLEEPGTWVLVGRGTVEDLAIRIASCLPGATGEASLVAGRVIAAGLLEFAAWDLEPAWFQRVLFARLDRLEVRQASALDEALLAVHVDVAAMVAWQDVDEARSARVMGQLRQVIDRLPPGPAGRAEVMVYLARLSRWLSTDPWPRSAQPAGPALAATVVERQLRITEEGGDTGDADDLAGRCARLVVLGGPGSGKTWLARRTARLCAQAALEKLAAGALPEEVELPLYTTCTRLAAAPLDDGIRHAVVVSALGLLPDVGGSRVFNALRALFEDRDERTLLVADSLDEARSADELVRQADSLPAAWRIVLTSRPGAWHRQLAIEADPSQKIGILRPLCYPADVEPFIAGWFTDQPSRAADLTAQLRDRPALQQAATVPLILAFYCIISGDRSLPVRGRDLYRKVINRLLTSGWRGVGRYQHDLDTDECLEILRSWAWSAAESDPVSGVGAWLDEFVTPRARLHRADEWDALDHVAAPLGLADPDTGMTRRRFVHRSIQEHLVAEHVALRMPATEAAAELLNHLWYDTDWEHVAPAALAMHPKREQVLKEMLCRVTGSVLFPTDLRAVDGCWEVRRFLAGVARESGEDEWSPAAAALIAQAWIDLATSSQSALDRVLARDWPSSNRPIICECVSLSG